MARCEPRPGTVVNCNYRMIFLLCTRCILELASFSLYIHTEHHDGSLCYDNFYQQSLTIQVPFIYNTPTYRSPFMYNHNTQASFKNHPHPLTCDAISSLGWEVPTLGLWAYLTWGQVLFGACLSTRFFLT